jgi:hypothetical protein
MLAPGFDNAFGVTPSYDVALEYHAYGIGCFFARYPDPDVIQELEGLAKQPGISCVDQRDDGGSLLRNKKEEAECAKDTRIMYSVYLTPNYESHEVAMQIATRLWKAHGLTVKVFPADNGGDLPIPAGVPIM